MNFVLFDNIKSVLKNKRNVAGGYIWRYEDDPLNTDDLKIITKKLNNKKKEANITI